MTTYFLAVTSGANGPRDQATNVCVTEGTTTVAAAAINVEINTTIAPNLSYADAVAMILSCLNYVQSDAHLPATSRVLSGLTLP